jgi:hypothetical protein
MSSERCVSRPSVETTTLGVSRVSRYFAEYEEGRGGIPNPEAIRFSDSVSGIPPRATPSEIGHSPHTVAALFGHPP